MHTLAHCGLFNYYFLFDGKEVEKVDITTNYSISCKIKISHSTVAQLTIECLLFTVYCLRTTNSSIKVNVTE